MNPTDKASRSTWKSNLWCMLLVAGTLAHLFTCFETPRNSGDLGRQLLTGVMVNEDGWPALTQPLTTWAPALAVKISWGEVPFNYPPLALVFSQTVAWIYPSLFAIKLALTLVEALNGWLVFRLLGDRRAGILYWCLPLSVWWVSHEGVMEPVQNLFVLFALRLWQERRAFASGALVLAIQVKLSALFLVPWIGLTTWRDGMASWAKSATVATLALVPTLLAALAYPVFSQVGQTLHWSAKFNPYHWRALFDHSFRWWLPTAFVVWVQMASVFVLIWITLQIFRSPSRALVWIAPWLFLVAGKFMGVFQHWYFVAFTPLWLIAVPANQRLAWFLFTQLCEPLSLWQLTFGPSGPLSPHGGFSLFEKLLKS